MLSRDWIVIAVGLAVVFLLMGTYSPPELPLMPAPAYHWALNTPDAPDLPEPSAPAYVSLAPPARPAGRFWDIDHWESERSPHSR